MSRGIRLGLQIRFPNPNLVPHGRFAPSLRVVDSYFGATSGPRLSPGCIFVGLLSSGTPGRPIHRSRGVTPLSVAPECLGDSKSRAGTRVHPHSLSYAQRGCESLAAVAMTNVY